jgi:hypothetical protein
MITKESGFGDLLSYSQVHISAWDGVEYGRGASSNRQNLDRLSIGVCGGSRARVYIIWLGKTLATWVTSHIWVGYTTPQSGSDPNRLAITRLPKDLIFPDNKRKLGSRLNLLSMSVERVMKYRAMRRTKRSARVPLLFSLTYQVVEQPILYAGITFFQLSIWD